MITLTCKKCGDEFKRAPELKKYYDESAAKGTPIHYLKTRLDYCNNCDPLRWRNARKKVKENKEVDEGSYEYLKSRGLA